MPSISADYSRHVTIDARPGHYLSFPDVHLTRQGKLLCVYRQADRHVAARACLLASSSADLGQTWSPPRYVCAAGGHCPRITGLDDGRTVIIDDPSKSQFWSLDGGESFHQAPISGAYITIPDRILPLRPDFYLTTGHTHRGQEALSKIRQAPSEQMVFASSNQGADWRPYSVLAFDLNLVLCEASMIRMPDGTLLAILRENSFVYEPMYICTSRDQGVTWSAPRPAPIPGHRPTLGLTPGGKLLVTYRDVGPDGGTAAWMGTFEELDRDYEVHGLHPEPTNPSLTPEGLLIANEPGPDQAARYALRPMTDPERAHAELAVDVHAEYVEEKACALHFGGWWRVLEGGLKPPAEDAPIIAADTTKPTRIVLRYTPGNVEARVNGELAGNYPADPLQADNRAILFGNASVKEKNGGRHWWKSVLLSIREPRYEREYSWKWEHSMGHPDAYARSRVLELANSRKASPGDYGYSGWTALPDGRYFCAYHHADGLEPGYEPGNTSHVRGTWFSDSDFG